MSILLIIYQAIFVWELVANGLDLDRIGKTEVFGVLDKIGEFFDNIDLAGNSLLMDFFKIKTDKLLLGSGPEGEPFSSLPETMGLPERGWGWRRSQFPSTATVAPIGPSALPYKQRAAAA